jgi:hypothetical protein
MIKKNFVKLLLTAILVAIASCSVIPSLGESSIKIDKRVTDVVIPKSKKTIILDISGDPSEKGGDYYYRIQRFAMNPPSELGGKVNGLCYLYYEGAWNRLPDFGKIEVIKSDKIEQPNIVVAGRIDQMAIQFYGYIKIDESGIYNFYTQSDDGSKIYIDDKLVVNNDGIHAIAEAQGKVALEKGFHSITIEFFENYGGEFLSVSYSGPNIIKRIIPDTAFYIPSSWNCSANKTNLTRKKYAFEEIESLE